MHIQSSQQNPSFVAELSQAVAGRLGQVEARQVATPREAQQLAQRQEAPKGEGLLSAWGRPRASLRGDHRVAGQTAGEPCPRLHPGAALPSGRAACRQSLGRRDQADDAAKALPLTLGGLGKASELATLTAERLAKDHTRLASGDGALRSLATALVGIRDGSRIEASRTQAARLLEQSVGGSRCNSGGPRAVPPASMYSAQARSNCAKSPSNCMR